jgi:hypothetical protein
MNDIHHFSVEVSIVRETSFGSGSYNKIQKFVETKTSSGFVSLINYGLSVLAFKLCRVLVQ